MEIHGSDIQFATLEVIPSNIKQINSSAAAVNLSCISYDEMSGQASIIASDGTGYNSVDYTTLPARIKIKGRNNGKVLFTAKTVNLYPAGFSKSWIAEVFDVPEYSDLYTRTPNGKVIDATKEYIDIIVGTARKYNLKTDSSYGLTSIDGVGKGYITLLTKSNNKELTYRIYPLTPGKIKFWGEMYEHIYGSDSRYVGRIEVEVDITELYKELTTEITTNTGLFEITDGGGQLEVYCTPNYNYAGDYSFSQVSIDGGSVSINDKGNYALITANKDGRLNLICRPDRGNPVQCEITVNNQYPKDVQLVTASGEFKLALGGELTVFAEAGNNPNPNYDEYTLLKDILYPDSAIKIVSGTKDWRLGGTGLGKVRIMARRSVDNSLVASAVVKIVQTLDSDKINLPFPNNYNNFILYRRANQSNKVWLVTIKDNISSILLKSDKKIYTDISLNNYSDYYLNGASWKNFGNWGGNNCLGNNVTIIYASSVNAYDEAGNIVVNASTYDEIDWNHVLYGE